MAQLPIKPPKVNVSSIKGSFWKQLGMIVLATTISLFFTIVAAQLMEKRHRAKDRRLSAMNMVEERWNNWVTEVEGTIRDIKDHPEEHEGSSLPMKSIRSEKVRHTLKGIHYWKSWLSYMAATMRYHNKHNMK